MNLELYEEDRVVVIEETENLLNNCHYHRQFSIRRAGALYMIRLHTVFESNKYFKESCKEIKMSKKSLHLLTTLLGSSFVTYL
jgi:predicted anti-sigma-YlaC factor YlaD